MPVKPACREAAPTTGHEAYPSKKACGCSANSKDGRGDQQASLRIGVYGGEVLKLVSAEYGGFGAAVQFQAAPRADMPWVYRLAVPAAEATAAAAEWANLPRTQNGPVTFSTAEQLRAANSMYKRLLKSLEAKFTADITRDGSDGGRHGRRHRRDAAETGAPAAAADTCAAGLPPAARAFAGLKHSKEAWSYMEALGKRVTQLLGSEAQKLTHPAGEKESERPMSYMQAVARFLQQRRISVKQKMLTANTPRGEGLRGYGVRARDAHVVGEDSEEPLDDSELTIKEGAEVKIVGGSMEHGSYWFQVQAGDKTTWVPERRRTGPCLPACVCVCVCVCWGV